MQILWGILGKVDLEGNLRGHVEFIISIKYQKINIGKLGPQR